MWQCRRCDSEVDETIPGCARCPFPVDPAAIERAAIGPLIQTARTDPEAAKATEVVPAIVIGMRYSDTQGSKGQRSVNHQVDLAFANRPANTFSFRTALSSKDGTPDKELLGQLVIAFLRGDTVSDWWPLEPRPEPPPEPVLPPDFPRATVTAPTSAGIAPEPFPPPTIAGVPRGGKPLLTPAGALVGLPVETLRPRLSEAQQHSGRARAMAAPLPRTLDINLGDFLFFGLGLALTFGFWVYGAYQDANGEKPWDEVPNASFWIGGVMSFVGLALIALIVRIFLKQLRAPVTRTLVAVVDARATEDGEVRVQRSTLLFEDGAVREYKILRPARAAATAGAVGVACFREDYVMAFLPLSS